MGTPTLNRACTGKIAFPTKDKATASMWRLINARGQRPNSVMVYKCQHCEQFHIGHRSRKTGRRSHG